MQVSGDLQNAIEALEKPQTRPKAMRFTDLTCFQLYFNISLTMLNSIIPLV